MSHKSAPSLFRPLWLLALCCAGLFVMMATGCERRDILRPANVHYIRVYVQDSVKNVTTGFYSPDRFYPPFAHPNVFRVMLYDPKTGHKTDERFLRQVGQDSTGYYVEGYVHCEPGDYRMMIYNNLTEATIVRDENDLEAVYATTNLASVNMTGRTRDEERPPLHNAPDLLFTCVEEDIHIPHLTHIDTLNNYIPHRLEARTVVETYYIQINVRGAQWVTDITAEVDGLSRSKALRRNEMSENESAINFTMAMADKRPADTDVKDSTAVLYAVFNTFGKIPKHSSNIMVSFNIIVKDGQGLEAQIDITEDFTKYDAVNHNWIILDKEIVVPPPVISSGGGFTPGVTRWDEVVVPIII